ncbi:hypothetical protein VPNG_05448 [Cytospora leucostoma]|uniref:Uncharacterized protein n=1 Tax=Cytospora leucostoma TaxID=1230097 RepID=A0A423XBP9_9PEZI|nr:hypothetical protein VPNG_05448 [Cytospora leucostoma]
MRLIHAAAAFGLLVCHALGQQWEDMGVMPDLSRRVFYEAFAHPPSLAKRDGDCGSDINSTYCCPNDKYCIVNETTYEAECCALGSTCGGPCNTNQYFANLTTTTTISSAATVETVFACVGRSCTSTNYLCPESFGGNCCQYGADCASGGKCLVPSTSSSSTAMSTIASEIPAGCSVQGQTTCTAGGGCCDSGYSCTVVSSTPMCAKASSTSSTAANTATPTASGVTVEHRPDSGLSTGAKAGIAVGVIVGAALITGVLTWLCIRRRRHRTGRSTTTGQEMDSGVGAPGGPNANGGVVAAAQAYPDGGPQQQHMSEAGEYGYAPSSAQVSYSSRAGPGPLPGLASDYFGAAAARGPYTDRNGEQATTPEYLAQPVRGEGQSPHGPDDVVGPVEIGAGGSVKREKVGYGFGRPRLPSHTGSSEGSELDGTMVGPPARRPSQQQQATPVRESIAERFELYGSEAVPPVSGDRGRDAASRQRAPQPLATPGSEVTTKQGALVTPSSHRTPKRRILLQVLDQLVNTGQMPPQHLLLGLLAQGAALARLHRHLCSTSATTSTPIANTITNTITDTDTTTTTTTNVGGRLGHEVEIQELHGLELDVAGGAARLEDGGDGEEAVQVLEAARVARGLDQGDHEDQEGGGLDGRAVDGLQEVEEELPARRVQEQHALQAVQRAQHEGVHAPVVALGQQPVERLDQPRGDVPLEAVLQLEELAEGGVVGQVGEEEL